MSQEVRVGGSLLSTKTMDQTVIVTMIDYLTRQVLVVPLEQTPKQDEKNEEEESR